MTCSMQLWHHRAHLIALARPSVAYCRTNGIDWRATEAASGGIFLAPVRPSGAGRFEFDAAGALAAVCEVLADDATTILDIVAWSVADPARVRTALGIAPALGMSVAADPATGFDGRPLQLFRTPLAWLQAGCDGAVLLDAERGARWLMNLPVPSVAAEDDLHAAQLLSARHGLIGKPAIVKMNKTEPRRAA